MSDNEVYRGPLTEAEIDSCLDEGADPGLVEAMVVAMLAPEEDRCVGCGRTPSEGIGCSSCPGYNSQGYPEGGDVQ